MGFPLWTREGPKKGQSHSSDAPGRIRRWLDLRTGYPTLIAVLEPLHKGERHDNLLGSFEDIRTLTEQSPALALEYLPDVSIERFGHASRSVYTGIFEFGTVWSRLSLSSLSLKGLSNTRVLPLHEKKSLFNYLWPLIAVSLSPSANNTLFRTTWKSKSTLASW